MGLNHIYCGNGKGKTTAAIGLALRAAGAGMRVYIFQFLKGSDTSELAPLRNSGITIERCDKDCVFSFQMNDSQKLKVTERHNDMLRSAAKLIESNAADMIILDEFLDAYNLDLLDKTLADSIALKHYDSTELIITGRNPSDDYIAVADYVSEINAVKHPYNNGISARKGIEY